MTASVGTWPLEENRPDLHPVGWLRAGLDLGMMQPCTAHDEAGVVARSVP
jgi:hypothetical protein